MHYTHLTEGERYQICALHKAGHPLAGIVRLLGRDPGMLSRECRRNRGGRGYRPRQAHALARQRATAARRHPRLSARQWRGIAALLRQNWSHEEIARRAARAGTLAVSPEWIYRYIYRDKAAGGTLWQHLRGRKRYRRRYGAGWDRRGQIVDRQPIARRPASVLQRRRLGDWEGDTLYGARQRGELLSTVERRSCFVRLGKLPRRSARAACRRRLGPLAERVCSLTVDNGQEFAAYRRLAQLLHTWVYFADPYAAWQRGTNENTNGLVHQYLPKPRDLTTVSGAEIHRIELHLNFRPRKCLGYLTPHEVFYHARLDLTAALRS